MYDYTLYRGKRHFSRCCLQPFWTAEKLEYHINDCFRINGKRKIKDTHREKALPNKTPAVRKSKNMCVFVVDTSNQLFIRGS